MASKSLGTLTLDLVAKIGGFVEGLDKAGRKSKSFNEQLGKQFAFGSKALAAGIATSIAATAALVKTSLDSADAIGKQRQITGLAAEDLSVLAYSAELSDVAFDELTGGFARFNRAVRDAVEGLGPGAKAFKALQIELRDANGELRNNMDLISDLADRFSRMEDGPMKAAIAQDLFGRSGARLIPLLNGGREGLQAMREEAERLGLVIDTETATAAEEFNDSLTRIKRSITGAGNEIARELLPQLKDFAETVSDPETQARIREFVRLMAEMAHWSIQVAAAGAGVARFVAESFGLDINDFRGLNEQLDRVNRQIDRLKEPRRGRLNVHDEQRLADLYAEQARLQQEVKDYQDEYAAKLKAGAAPPPPAPTPFSIDGELSDQEKLNKLFEERLAQYQQQATLGADASELRRVQYEMEHGALRGLNEAQKEQLELWAQAVSTQGLEQLMDAQRESAQQLEADLRKQIALFGEVGDAARLRYELEQEAFAYLEPETKARLVALAEELDMQRELAEEDKARQKEMEAQGKVIQEIGAEAARNIQGHFADFLFDPFDQGVKGMARSFAATIRRMSAEAASAAILKAVFGGMAGSQNSFLAAIGGSFAGMKDGGGSIGAGQWGIVGEIGPEIVRGPAHVTSRAETARMLGSPDVTVINNTGVAATARATTTFDGGRARTQIILDAVKDGASQGLLDDVFAQFGATRARGLG